MKRIDILALRHSKNILDAPEHEVFVAKSDVVDVDFYYYRKGDDLWEFRPVPGGVGYRYIWRQDRWSGEAGQSNDRAFLGQMFPNQLMESLL